MSWELWRSYANAPFIDQEEAVADSGMTGYWCKNRDNAVARSGVTDTRDETAKPAGAAKRDGAAVWNDAESCRTVTCGLIVGPKCRNAFECGSHVSCAQRKGMAPRGAP